MPRAEEAELTILASFPTGAGNAENLRLASRARRLVIVTPGPGDPPRTFFSEEGRRLFAELLRDLESGRIPE